MFNHVCAHLSSSTTHALTFFVCNALIINIASFKVLTVHAKNLTPRNIYCRSLCTTAVLLSPRQNQQNFRSRTFLYTTELRTDVTSIAIPPGKSGFLQILCKCRLYSDLFNNTRLGPSCYRFNVVRRGNQN